MSAVAQTNASRTPAAMGSNTYCCVVLTTQMTINTVSNGGTSAARPWATAARKCRTGRGRLRWMSVVFVFHGDSCPGKHCGDDSDSTGLFQHPGRLAARGAGCKNIIYQQDTRALQGPVAAGGTLKCPANVASPIRGR